MSTSPASTRRLIAGVLSTLAAAVALAGCGLGPGEQAAGVHLRVTDDFGAKVLAEPDRPKQEGADTVMRLLQRNATVTTRYGGGFVQSINGLSGQADAGQQLDWFYYVNGVLAGRGAAAWKAREGERIWWDRHRWDVGSISAVVGDYPQPMLAGHDGKYAGAQLDCRAAQATCDAVRDRLQRDGITVSTGDAARAGDQTRLVVGAWRQIRDASPEVRDLARGPEQSGVFATISDAGTPRPVDRDGRPLVSAAVVRSDGLIAATKPDRNSPVWVVTGADEPAVAAAVRALDADALAGAPAVLIRDGRALALPLRADDPGREVDQ